MKVTTGSTVSVRQQSQQQVNMETKHKSSQTIHFCPKRYCTDSQLFILECRQLERNQTFAAAGLLASLLKILRSCLPAYKRRLCDGAPSGAFR